MADPLSRTAAETALKDLDGWTLSKDGRAISRRWTFRNFARAMRLANLAGWQAEAQNHHPDLRVGWGYCEVTFTTHDAGGLTQADLDAAAALQALVAAAD